MYEFFAAESPLDSALEQSKSALERITGILNGKALLTFLIAIIAAMIIGRLIAAVMRRFARSISQRADKAQDLKKVNQLRRIETLIILSVALIRGILFVLAIYFAWVYSHPGGQPTALIGASALVVIVAGATIGPILRDIAYGGVMMAEHWFGVGDFVKVEPFADLEGVVERVTLRSTRIRGINGEVIWLNNQNIQGVRVSPKGVRTIAIDIFVSDHQRGLDMIEQINLRLPRGPLMVARPLHIMHQSQVGPELWNITAIGETAPGREWLLREYAVELMKEMDEANTKKVMQTEPIARYADADAERRFARTIQNARKSNLQKRRLPLPEAITDQIKDQFKDQMKPFTKKSADRAAARKKRNRKIQ